jgi:hypothetical protein
MSYINSPETLRTALLASIEAVIEGRMNVPQANSVAALAAEVHSSVRQEFDMRCFAAQSLTIEQQKLIKIEC